MPLIPNATVHAELEAFSEGGVEVMLLVLGSDVVEAHLEPCYAAVEAQVVAHIGTDARVD